MADHTQVPHAPLMKSPIHEVDATPLLIDTKAAATMLAMGFRSVWRYTKCNAIPSRKIGSSVRYCPDELRAWIVAGCPTEPGAGDRIRKTLKMGGRR